MDIKELAKIFFLRMSDKEGLEILKRMGYDFSNETIFDEIKNLDAKYVSNFLEEILRISDEYEIDNEDKSMTLYSCLRNLSIYIGLGSLPLKERHKYFGDPYYTKPLTRPELINISTRFAKKIIELHPEPGFMKYLINQHIGI